MEKDGETESEKAKAKVLEHGEGEGDREGRKAGTGEGAGAASAGECKLQETENGKPNYMDTQKVCSTENLSVKLKVPVNAGVQAQVMVVKKVAAEGTGDRCKYMFRRRCVYAYAYTDMNR